MYEFNSIFICSTMVLGSTMLDTRIPYDQTALCDTLSIEYDPNIKNMESIY